MSAADHFVRISTHPVAEGAAALVALMGALFAPIGLGYGVATSAGMGTPGTYATGAVGALAGVASFNRMLWQTRVYGWTVRLLEWTGRRGIGGGGSA